MTEIKKDQRSQQPPGNSVQQQTKHSLDPDLNKENIKEPENEEITDVVITEQRKPQFRYSENYGRRNF